MDKDRLEKLQAQAKAATECAELLGKIEAANVESGNYNLTLTLRHTGTSVLDNATLKEIYSLGREAKIRLLDAELERLVCGERTQMTWHNHDTAAVNACPKCGLIATASCRCPGPHSFEDVVNGHGSQCANGHRWCYQADGYLIYDTRLTISPEPVATQPEAV